MLLKLKALLYRYTGIFLANREKLDYLDSDLFWEALTKKKSSESLRFRASLSSSLWEAKNGFYRGVWRHTWEELKPATLHLYIAGWFVVFYRTLLFDVSKTYKSVSHKVIPSQAPKSGKKKSARPKVKVAKPKSKVKARPSTKRR